MTTWLRQHYCNCAFCAIAIFFYMSPIQAQPLSPSENIHWSIGAEGGWMRNIQSGSFVTCGCPISYDEGKGNSGAAVIFIQLELSNYISLGSSFGVERIYTTGSKNSNDNFNLIYSIDSIRIGNFPVTRIADVSVTYISFVPYIKIAPFGKGFFFLGAPEFGYLTSSHLSDTRSLNSTITLQNGETLSKVRFQNGSSTETLQDSSIPSANKLRIAALFSIGYDIPILDNFSLMPQANYNLALTNVSSDPKTNIGWKISSWALMLGVRYKL